MKEYIATGIASKLFLSSKGSVMEGKAEMESPAKEVSASGADASYHLSSHPHSQIMYMDRLASSQYTAQKTTDDQHPPRVLKPPIRTVRRKRRAHAWTRIKMPR
jgi:hypothetical protein